LKYTLTKESADKINALIHKNSSSVFKDDVPAKILNELFDGTKKSYSTYYKKRQLNKLSDYGLISIIGSEYVITNYGKYRIIAKTMNINFLSLCALSEKKMGVILLFDFQKN